MCRPPALKILTNKDHLINKVYKPKRVSFNIEEKQAQPQNNDVIFSQMFILAQFKNNLQTALERILVLEKELEESRSREKVLQLFCEKHKINNKKLQPQLHDYNVRQTIV